MNRRARVVALVLVAGAAIGLLLLARGREPAPQLPAQSEPSRPAPEDARWIIAGGGPLPESNEISIEDDVILAGETFEGDGLTFYASGASSRAVRVEATDLPDDELVRELGAFFNPRGGRASRYAPTRLGAAHPAMPTPFLDAVAAAAGAPGPALLVYVAGHGEAGASPSQNSVAMWANTSFTPVDLADALAKAGRRTRVVVTTCFSGGFAELAFREANEELGAAESDVCGLFASTWDREAGGCDPNPDRGMHDGYGVHFLNALAGARRDGSALPLTSVDLDADGTISLLDAHTFARLSSTSIDIPTTTSERWLRANVPAEAQGAAAALPHEDAVIAAIGKRLSVPDEPTARRRLAEFDGRLEAATEGESAAAEDESNAYWDAAGELLARWPTIDDPWHPLWRETIERDREAIAAFLSTSPAFAAWRKAAAKVDKLATTRAELEVQRAPLHRLVRAFETRRLAGVLQAQGGAEWARFKALRACETSAP